MTRSDNWFYRRGDLARGGWDAVVDNIIPGWLHTGLRIADLNERSFELAAGLIERIVVPLSGDVFVEWSDPDGLGAALLVGRDSVFSGPADVMYLGINASGTIRGSGRVAIAEASATERVATTVLRGQDVPVEIRGSGRSTRQVHNFGMPGGLPAQKLLVCEVITPAENWSSFPAHKHDEDVPGEEMALEEIYYFESDVTRGVSAPVRAEPFGMFATYSSPTGDIKINELVRTGDIALVPYGYHGPAVAVPGYDLYYLNVMAGPGDERAWRASDDPAHAWVRPGWESQTRDPRLPYGSNSA